MITENIFLSSSTVQRILLLVKAVSRDWKLPWCWLYEKSFVTTLQMYISFLRAGGGGGGGGGGLKQLILLSINIHSTLYLKSFKLGRDIESDYMKTVIWGSCLVQRKYQRLLKLSFEYVVYVHVNWMQRYLENTRLAIV